MIAFARPDPPTTDDRNAADRALDRAVVGLVAAHIAAAIAAGADVGRLHTVLDGATLVIHWRFVAD